MIQYHLEWDLGVKSQPCGRLVKGGAFYTETVYPLASIAKHNLARPRLEPTKHD